MQFPNELDGHSSGGGIGGLGVGMRKLLLLSPSSDPDNRGNRIRWSELLNPDLPLA